MAVWIEHFKIFLDLAETKSFTATAERNGLSQAGISTQLRILEKEFASRFAIRSNKKFQLTPEGELLLQYAQEIVKTCNEFKAKFNEIQPVASNHIRLAVTPYIGLYCLPPFLHQFRADHPQASIQVEYRRTEQICEDVLNNDADLGLVALRIKDAKLESILFQKKPLVLICHPRHKFARQKSTRLAAFEGQTFISFEQGFPGFQQLEHILRRGHITKRKVVYFNDIEPIKRAVEIGVGVAIVPEGTVRQEVANQTLAALSIADGDFYHPLAAVRNRKMECTPVLKQFIAVLKKVQTPPACNNIHGQ
ncbi:MAG: LysR family transcriptional regulator [Verrucomicrobiia bacterium]